LFSGGQRRQVMKKGFFCLGIVFFVLISCGVGSGRDYTYEELQVFANELNPIGTHFWEEFGSLREKYRLTDNESKIVGVWSGFKEKSAQTFVFYPNGLFMICFGGYKYKMKENKSLTEGYGIWEVRGNMLVVTMHGFTTITRGKDVTDKTFEYFGITPYEQMLININDVAAGGYTRKPFRRFVLPGDLRSMIHLRSDAGKKNLMARSIYNIRVITNSGNFEKNYAYLNVVPDMAADNVSGLEVATSSELVKKYFENLVY
jgi:hypothetical protein